MRDGQGNVVGASAIARDITERKRAEAERERLLVLEREQNERLRELDRLKDEFVALVSHELRTPLTSIRGYLELVLDGEAGDVSDEQRQFLAVVERNADRLLALVGDLLFLAQIEAGKLTLEVGAVDLGAIASESVDAARPQADDKDITLSLAVGPVPLLGTARASASSSTTSSRTRSSSRRRRGRVDVRAGAQRHGRYRGARQRHRDPRGGARAAVRALLPKLERRRAADPGTGLGLAISKAIVEAHGGAIASRARSTSARRSRSRCRSTARRHRSPRPSRWRCEPVRAEQERSRSSSSPTTTRTSSPSSRSASNAEATTWSPRRTARRLSALRSTASLTWPCST